MSTSFSTADLRQTLRFPFQSKSWLNHFIIGSGLLLANSFIPFLPVLLVYGYMLRLMRHTLHETEVTMPEWGQWGDLFKDGLRCVAIGLVYLGPSLIIFMGGAGLYFMTMMGGVMLTEQRTSRGMPMFPAIMFGAVMIFFAAMFIGWLLGIVGTLPLPVALAHATAQNRLSAAFDLRALATIIRADKWGYLLSWVLVLGLFQTIYFIFLLFYFTVILCFIGYLLITPITFYLMLVSTAVFGQFYRENMPQPTVGSGA